MNYAIRTLQEEVEMIKRSLSNFDKDHHPKYYKEKEGIIQGLENAINYLQKK